MLDDDIFNGSVSGQQTPWIDFADAKTDLESSAVAPVFKRIQPYTRETTLQSLFERILTFSMFTSV